MREGTLEGTFVFAYGSNMDSSRFQGRAPSAEVVGTTRLRMHVRRFDRKGADGSGKANIVPSKVATDVVHGVVYSIDPIDLAALDKIEVGYDRRLESFTVRTANGLARVQARVYIATEERCDVHLKSTHVYLAHVVRGAREHGLPLEVIAELEATPTQN